MLYAILGTVDGDIPCDGNVAYKLTCELGIEPYGLWIDRVRDEFFYTAKKRS